MQEPVTEKFDDLVLKFERAIRAHESQPFDAVMSVLKGLLKETNALGGLLERGNSYQAMGHWYTRLAASLTEYFVHPDNVLTLSQLHALCIHKQQIANIFAASGYGGTSHLASLMSSSRTSLEIPGKKAPVLLAATPLNGLTSELLDLAKTLSPEVLLRLILGWLSERSVLTEAAENARTEILTWGPLIENVEIEDSLIPSIAFAYMYCTYANSSEKHAIKKSLNKLLIGRMNAAGIAPPPVTHIVKERPRLLVIHERFQRQHAMFRCYAPWIAKLRDRFQLVALAEEDGIDEGSADLFANIVKLPKGFTVADAVKTVIDIAPDIIFYPSIGMSYWVIMLSNLRLAAVQLMTPGHPATSGSEAIDYIYLPGVKGDAIQKLHVEKIVVGPLEIDFIPHSDLPEKLPELLPESERQVRVAVVSKVMKLSHRLMNICSRLSREARYPVAFSFFPGERFASYDGLVSAIQALVPDAAVFPYQSYPNFLDQISKCDIALAAFPFGNTNSTIDTCLLGLPTVAHFGPEAPAQSDSIILQNAGFADWLVCQSDEDYYQTALSLINDPKLRQSAIGEQDRDLIKQNLFPVDSEKVNPFPDVVMYLYKNHQRLMSADERVFNYRDLLSDAAGTH